MLVCKIIDCFIYIALLYSSTVNQFRILAKQHLFKHILLQLQYNEWQLPMTIAIVIQLITITVNYNYINDLLRIQYKSNLQIYIINQLLMLDVIYIYIVI